MDIIKRLEVLEKLQKAGLVDGYELTNDGQRLVKQVSNYVKAMRNDQPLPGELLAELVMLLSNYL